MKPNRLAPHIKDGEMCENSRTLRLLFLERLADFEAFDPSLNMAFADAWKAAVEQFEGHQTDENTLDLLQYHTQVLANATEKALGLVRGLEYYVEQAYPGMEYKKAEFGLDVIGRKRYKNFADMVNSLFATYDLMMMDLADFTAAGMPASFPSDFLAAANETNLSQRKQEVYKIIRLRLTRQRVEMFNHLYHLHRQVAKAARVIFTHNPVVMELYTKY